MLAQEAVAETRRARVAQMGEIATSTVAESEEGAAFTSDELQQLRHAFDRVGLHRLQISIIPRNSASRRVVEKLGVRYEGLAEGYLRIAGVWEDHMRFGITAEEWEERRDKLWQLVSEMTVSA